MKRFVLIDTAEIPDGGGALCLFEYGDDFVIKIQGGNGNQLMPQDRAAAATTRADWRLGHGLHPRFGAQTSRR